MKNGCSTAWVAHSHSHRLPQPRVNWGKFVHNNAKRGGLGSIQAICLRTDLESKVAVHQLTKWRHCNSVLELLILSGNFCSHLSTAPGFRRGGRKILEAVPWWFFWRHRHETSYFLVLKNWFMCWNIFIQPSSLRDLAHPKHWLRGRWFRLFSELIFFSWVASETYTMR